MPKKAKAADESAILGDDDLDEAIVERQRGGRLSREAEAKLADKGDKNQSWRPASLIPDLPELPGYKTRWVRTSMRGERDDTNVSRALAEGWVPVTVEEAPEIAALCSKGVQGNGNIEIGGLIACKMPEHMVDQRNAYYKGLNQASLDAIDNDLMALKDRRAPLFHKSSVKNS